MSAISRLEPASGAAAEATHLADYDYQLPAERIAQTPLPERDAARLLVLERRLGSVRHAVVRDLPRLLRAGDLLVFNDARVRPARLFCRTASGGAVELLVVGELGPGLWSCLGRPAKRLRAGTSIVLPDGTTASVRARAQPGRYVLAADPSIDLGALLAQYGELPLPPYIKRPDGPLALDRERYQTVFAARDGAVAAPTAGLHFTPALLAALDRAGVRRATLTLAVGPGTFLPVRSDDVREHRMDAEWVELPDSTVAAIAETKAAGGRVIAVGTTTTRALEAAALRAPAERAPAAPPPGAGGGWAAGTSGGFWAEAFIRPGFRFQVVDALLTNFHLPRSTLLMLVSAFAGRARMLDAYALAVREGYRFYSYGDAMLLC